MTRYLCAAVLAALSFSASSELISGRAGGAENVANINSAGQIATQHGAGERAEDSADGSDHLAVSGECASSGAIDLSTDASTTVWDGPAVLCGIVLSVTVGTAAATIDDNATARYPVPVALPIGAHAGLGTIFETTLVVNPADGSTGTLWVYFRPLDPTVTWAYP